MGSREIKIKEVMNKVCPDISLLQETKKEHIEKMIIRNIWDLSFKD